MNSHKKFIKIVSVMLTILTVFFSAFYARKLLLEIGSVSVDILYIVLSLLLFIAFYVLLSYHWLRAIRMIESEVSMSQSLAFFASQPYKYLPSSLFTFSFRAKYSHDLGLSLKRSSLSQVLENLVLLSSGAYIGILFFASMTDPVYSILILICTAIGTIALKETYNVHFRSTELTLITKDVLKNFSITSLAWVVCGLSFYFMNEALAADLPLFDSVASNSIAYITGILAFFAPGGVGIREAVYGFFSVQVAAILAWRFLTFIIDITTGILAIGIIRYKKLKSS